MIFFPDILFYIRNQNMPEVITTSTLADREILGLFHEKNDRSGQSLTSKTPQFTGLATPMSSAVPELAATVLPEIATPLV